MTQSINILLLDDNEIIAACIEKRLLKANETFFETKQVEIIPTHLKVDNTNPINAGKTVETYLTENKVDILLMDRGFFNIIDPEKIIIDQLANDTLYVPKDERSIRVTEILQNVNFKKVEGLKGVILYTYDEPSRTSEWYVEPAQIKQELKNIFGNKVAPDCIDVVLTNSEIYHLANLQLYSQKPVQVGDYLVSGKKSDFMLYGLFMGEILYHRTISLLEKRQKKNLKLKQGNVRTKLIILFVVFTALSMGSSAIYSLAMKTINSDVGLLLLSIVFSFLFPILILTLKPHWIIDLSDE